MIRGGVKPHIAALLLAPKKDQPTYHSGIRIERNTFVLPGCALVSAERVSRLEVVGNDVQAAEGAVLPEAVRPFELRACRDVRIEGNRFELGRPVTLDSAVSVPGLVVRGNRGMKDAP